jgi:DNA-directed RNA polymerase subunit RPC12/RpoP
LSNEKESAFACKECGSQFPSELNELLINGESIFCESCGTENTKKDFDERKITHVVQQKKSKNLWNVLTNAKKAAIKKKNQVKKKIKSKLKD